MLIVVKENKADQVILHQNEIHTFVDKEIVKYKAQKGVACFYKVPKKLDIVGEKRVMRFDTRNRKFHVDGTTGKRLYKKGKKRTTTPENNMLVTDVEVTSGYKFRNVPFSVSITDLAQEIGIGIFTEHTFLRVTFGAITAICLVVVIAVAN